MVIKNGQARDKRMDNPETNEWTIQRQTRMDKPETLAIDFSRLDLINDILVHLSMT
jgi:hypothetical protein